MTQISLNTDDLKNGSYDLKTFSAELAKITSHVGSSSSGLDGKYDGQLASQVNRIAAQAQNTGTDKKNKLLELSEFLARKASAFEAVDNENLGSVLGVTNQMSWLESSYPVAASSATINPLYLDKATSIWALGGFYLGNFKDWISKFPPFSWIGGKETSEIPVIPPPKTSLFLGSNVKMYKELGSSNQVINLKPGENVEIMEQKTDSNGIVWALVKTNNGNTGWISKEIIFQSTLISESKTIGENVRSGINEKDQLFPRLAYDGKTYSNCTWYAAAAVSQESGGKIDLNDSSFDWRSYPALTDKNGNELGRGWGSGGEWSSYADGLFDDYSEANVDLSTMVITGKSDFFPTSGAVLNDVGLGHVAFVEQVWLSEDNNKIFVIVSEENAGYFKDGVLMGVGSPIKSPSEKIAVEGGLEVDRYRRTIVFDNVNKEGAIPTIESGNIKFIHFNYE